MSDALIGYTGFVGSNLRRLHHFSALFNSNNIGDAVDQAFETVVCAAAPGSMVEANKFPQRDAERLKGLKQSLLRISAKRFVLVSTVAVYADFAKANDEETSDYQKELAYGRNRRDLEEFCLDQFGRCLIIRLPALFGSDLKKNFLFDILNPMPTMLTEEKMRATTSIASRRVSSMLDDYYRYDPDTAFFRLDRSALNASAERAELETAMKNMGMTALQFTNRASAFQFYSLKRLWSDIDVALDAGLTALNAGVEPLQAQRVFRALTGEEMPETNGLVHRENLQTKYAEIWGRTGQFLEDADAVLACLKIFFKEETAST